MTDRAYTVSELETLGWLRVEDGNHGEYRPRQEEFGFGEIRFIRAADMEAGRVSFDSAARISDTAVARIRKGLGMPGDILFSHKGTVGKLALVPPDAPPFVCSPQTTFWRTCDESRIDRHYLFYFLMSDEFTNQWEARKGETDMADYVSLTAQRELTLRLPSIEQQRRIGALLRSVDDKIRVNQQVTRDLETLAASLFESWFVDFDPVQAKLENRALVGVPEDAAHLFPGHFKDSGAGPVPEAWLLGRVADEFNITMGQSPPGNTYNQEDRGLPFYQGRTDFGFRFPARRVSCTAPTRIAAAGDTLVSVRAPVGDINLAWERCAIGRGVAGVRHRSGARSFTYYAMKSLRDEFVVYESEGTLFGAIGGEAFRSLPFVRPSPDVIALFEGVVSPMDDRVEANELQNRVLLEMRQTLLPAIMRGDASLGPIERVIAEAV